MDLSGNTGFLQWVQKVTSVGCNNWLISIHVDGLVAYENIRFSSLLATGDVS